MANLTVAEKPTPQKGDKPYISRIWLSNTPAPTVTVNIGGRDFVTKAFKVESHNTRRHALLYIEDVNPDDLI